MCSDHLASVEREQSCTLALVAPERRSASGLNGGLHICPFFIFINLHLCFFMNSAWSSALNSAELGQLYSSCISSVVSHVV